MAPRTARLFVTTILTASALTAGAVVVSAQQPAVSAAPDDAASAPAAPKKAAPPPPPQVSFKSLDGVTELVGYLSRPPGDEPRAAIVMMHGCSGLLNKSGRIFSLYRAWARTLVNRGYVVLDVDSAKSRGFGETCSSGASRRTMWRDRPKDAYAALAYLQAQSFVQADRIALMGWSQGGGVVLLTISDKSIGRPSDLPTGFAAAVSFYPGACADKWQSKPYTRVEPEGWTTHVPVLVLFGEADTWTEFPPCRVFLAAAQARGNPVELKTYPAAGHGFDAPDTPRIELPQYREADGRIPVIGTDKEARADAVPCVLAFLAAKLGR